jgi:hypothetical protein
MQHVLKLNKKNKGNNLRQSRLVAISEDHSSTVSGQCTGDNSSPDARRRVGRNGSIPSIPNRIMQSRCERQVLA